MNIKHTLLAILIFLTIYSNINANDFLSIQNKFLKVIINKNTGQFYIKTTGGNPDYTFDNNKKIIDKYASTFLSLKIDDFVFKYSEKSGEFIDTFHKEDNKLKAIWENNNIKIFQTIEFVKSPYSEITNTVRITYKILNVNEYPLKIGGRLLLDTSIGDDEIKKFRLPDNEIISRETEIKKTPTSFFWLGYKDLSKPGVFVCNTFDIANPPDKIVFASLAKISKTLWDYKIDKNNDFRKEILTEPDSAVAIYWNPKILQPDNIIKFSTDYGLLDATYKKNNNIAFLMINSKYITNNSPAHITIKLKNITATNINNLKINISTNKNLTVTKYSIYKKFLKKHHILNFRSAIDTKNNINGVFWFNINITGILKNAPIKYSYSDFVIANKYTTQKKITAITTTNSTVPTNNKSDKNIYSISIQKTNNSAIKDKGEEIQSIKTSLPTNKIKGITTNFIETGFIIYYINRGDTLSQILARLFHINKWQKLKKYITAIGIYNKLKNNNLIYEHNYIFIPCINIKKKISKNELADNFLGGDIKKIRTLSRFKEQNILPAGSVIIFDNIIFLKTGIISQP